MTEYMRFGRLACRARGFPPERSPLESIFGAGRRDEFSQTSAGPYQTGDTLAPPQGAIWKTFEYIVFVGHLVTFGLSFGRNKCELFDPLLKLIVDCLQSVFRQDAS
jgi:hypothetical protein